MKLGYEEQFISILRGQSSIQSFEIWLYENCEMLENLIGKDLCFKLLNLNYKSKFVIDELEPLLVEILGYGSVEAFKIKDLLNLLVKPVNDDEFISVCRRIYNEYCNGYYFLRLLALKYIVCDYDYQLKDNEARAQFLSEYRDEFINEGKRILNFFESGTIKVTDVREW